MRGITEEQLRSFRAFVEGHDFFYVAGHKEPDGDCVASCLALGMLLEECGKAVQLLSAGPFRRTEINEWALRFSATMRFLTNEERRRAGLVIVDCSDESRLGDIEGDRKGLDTFIIDHHRTNVMQCSGAVASGAQDLARGASGGAVLSCNSIVDDTSPAASCLVQMLYEGLRGKIKEDAARILFLGLATDTGYFRFLREDSGEVFRAAARLVDAGVSPRMIYDDMTGGKPWSTRKLLGAVLCRAERYLEGRLVITYETMEDTLKWGEDGRDNDALYQALLSTSSVVAAVFLRQETERTCTGGFRSRGDVDVSAIAAKFGGGGHKNASGMSIEGNIDTLLPQVVKEFAKIL